jgi:general stress protein YciG
MNDDTTDRTKTRDREFYRRIGSKGGRATVERHGREHMSRIGRKGFQATTDKYFDGDREAHKRWIARRGAFIYWSATGLDMKRDAVTGAPIWKCTPHPSINHPDNHNLPF